MNVISKMKVRIIISENASALICNGNRINCIKGWTVLYALSISTSINPTTSWLKSSNRNFPARDCKQTLFVNTPHYPNISTALNIIAMLMWVHATCSMASMPFVTDLGRSTSMFCGHIMATDWRKPNEYHSIRQRRLAYHRCVCWLSIMSWLEHIKFISKQTWSLFDAVVVVSSA